MPMETAPAPSLVPALAGAILPCDRVEAFTDQCEPFMAGLPANPEASR